MYRNLRINKCQNLGVFHKSHFFFFFFFFCYLFFDAKNPWPTFACQNLGTFKEYKDIGLTSYRNLRFSICQNLGLFHNNHVFLMPKNPLSILLVKILGFLKRTKILAYILSKCQVKHLSKSWCISKEPCFWHQKTHGLLLLVKILRLSKSTKILGLHRIEILSLAYVKILGYFIRTMFFDTKNPWPTFACQNLGIFKENRDFGPTVYKNVK